MSLKIAAALLVAAAAIKITQKVQQYRKRRQPGRHQWQDGDIVMLMVRNAEKTLIWGHKPLEYGYLGAAA